MLQTAMFLKRLFKFLNKDYSTLMRTVKLLCIANREQAISPITFWRKETVKTSNKK